ncbi:inorganic pyrophosphatase [Mycoplasmoides fastidiosum]|uniref:Inorganic pyrophosphatase n=1 Tax=Mycoplasmoides fastidiosum TaxID=92758 RepID=A0ABU0LY99_9BACT|nr:inorganic diphosphatase [Mycoplasmoides fastidiosum]MDQ0513674.1 inorganic pyrophosphatase [Mycoplasmoides fastidiosum]UUD37907.1 inorganic diphosphatase [Mycoplasmoides fastidiosum]
MNQKFAINVVIEIPKDSNIKYEYNRADQRLYVDRILYGASFYPQNYGFIERTIDWDGDELDALVIADQAFQVGSIVPARILGAMSMIDGGEKDTKLITVIDVDPRYSTYQNITDVPPHLLDEIKDFFATYKNLQKKKVEVGQFHDVKYAIQELQECQSLYQNYKNLAKNEFLKLMQEKHPEKYQK